MTSKKPDKSDTSSSDRMSMEAPGDAFFSALIARIEKEPYPKTAITGGAAKELAAKLVSPADSAPDLEKTVRAFFALDANSVEAVLSEARRLVPELYPSGEGRAIPLGPENEIAVAVSELNRHCLAECGLPFHRATLLRQAKSIDTSDAAVKLGGFVGGAFGPKSKDCPRETYPRYVGAVAPWPPWKLQFSFLQYQRQRPEDSGCNWHFQYSKKIRGWVGLAPVVYVVVAANSWGMKLAASDTALFVKWWTLVPVGLLPPVLAAMMPTMRC
jgi:hypothetical protein